MNEDDASIGFKVATMAGAFGAAFLARKLVTTAWQAVTGSEPPVNPEDPDTTWAEAAGWALLSGAVIGLARLAAARQVTAGYRKRTGKVPGDVNSSTA